MVAVTAPKDWPIRFSPVGIERRFAHEKGTQVRAVLPWKLLETYDAAQPGLAALARDKGIEAGAKKVDQLIIRVAYFDADGREYGHEFVNLVLVRGQDAVPLQNMTPYVPASRDEK